MAFEFFSKDLDTMELKFIGLFFCLILGIFGLILRIDLITGFMASTISFMIRDLYRSSTNEASRGLNGGGKDDKNTNNLGSGNISN